MADHPRKHGYAAFERADVADAKRGRPSVDLSGYAAAQGLEFPGSKFLAGFKRAQPAFPEYMYNVMRGEISSGGYGVLLHELFEIATVEGGSLSMAGGFHSVNRRTPGGFWRGLVPNRTSIPVLGNFLDTGDDAPREAFDTDSVWVPCTIAAVHVPEANGVAKWLHFRRGDRVGRLNRRGARDLAPYGLPDWYLFSDPKVGDELAARIMAGPAVEVFRGWEGGYLDVNYGFGTLRLRRNGYLPDPGRLGGDAVALGRQLAEACLPDAVPRGFEDELAGADWEEPELPMAWAQLFVDYAKEHGLTHEDPLAFHRAFPRLPSPGRAVAVMRGPLPGAPGHGRVVYYAENPVLRHQNVRGAVVLPTSHADTPLGGVRFPEERLVFEARDGVAVLWSTETWGWRWATEDTVVARALALAEARGLATVAA